MIEKFKNLADKHNIVTNEFKAVFEEEIIEL